MQEIVPALLVFCAFMLAERLGVYVRIGRQHHGLSLSELPLVGGLLLLSPWTLIVVRVMAGFTVLRYHRQQPRLKLAFNVVLFWIETVLAVILWRAFLGGADVTEPRGWLAVLGTLAVTGLLGGALVAVAIRLAEGRKAVPIRSITISGTLSTGFNGTLALIGLFVLEVNAWAAWTLVLLAVGAVFAYRAHTELQRRNSGLERLEEFSETIGLEQHAESVAIRVIEEVRRLLEVDVAELAVETEDSGVLRLTSRRGEPIRILDTDERTLASSFVDQHWDAQTVLIRSDSRAPLDRAMLDAAGCRDVVVAPVADDSEVIGTLLVAGRSGDVGTFDEHEQMLLTALASHASIALKNGRLADSLRREASEKEYQSLHDMLTGLPNRKLFHARVDRFLQSGRQVGILLLDLDEFKEVNDTLGHQMGDRLLVEVARRLEDSIPPEAVVARLGGDEFVICVPDASPGDERPLAEAVRRALGRPMSVGGLGIEVDVSIGGALSPQHGEDPAMLLQHADVAMYVAKEARSGFEVYTADRDHYSPRRLAMVSELRQGIDAGQLLVHYQPKVDVPSGHVIGAEALVRWEHQRYGLVPPDEFIPIAEQIGLIRPLTLAVLREALRNCARWRAAGMDLGMAVNLSPRSLLDTAMPEDVQELLDLYGIPPDRLTLEITESSMMTDPQRSNVVLRRFAEMGVQLAVDDFGIGYSSLAYLKRLPVDEIKIDRSFVQTMLADPSDAAIVGTVISLAHALGKRVVAEGVEEQDAYESLRRLGCDSAQGYWLSRPLTARAFEDWLGERTAAMRTTTQLFRPHPVAAEQVPSVLGE